ncbi:MAG: hypothetical protein ACE5DI_06095 [Candidatus Micrarchaeia archaeon]
MRGENETYGCKEEEKESKEKESKEKSQEKEEALNSSDRLSVFVLMKCLTRCARLLPKN